jgi:hypothetical protein
MFIEDVSLFAPQVGQKSEAQRRIANADPFRMLGEQLSGKNNLKEKQNTKGCSANTPPALPL